MKTNLIDPVKSPTRTSILSLSIDVDFRKIETKQLSVLQISMLDIMSVRNYIF